MGDLHRIQVSDQEIKEKCRQMQEVMCLLDEEQKAFQIQMGSVNDELQDEEELLLLAETCLQILHEAGTLYHYMVMHLETADMLYGKMMQKVLQTMQ